jgi:hypothetical protein
LTSGSPQNGLPREGVMSLADENLVNQSLDGD